MNNLPTETISNEHVLSFAKSILHFYEVFESAVKTGVYENYQETKEYCRDEVFKYDLDFSVWNFKKKPLAFIGASYGDEGKGKTIASFLTNPEKMGLPQYKDSKPICVRYNGGPNAGHVVYLKGAKFVLHQVPIGFLFGHLCFLGPGCVIDPVALSKELVEIEKIASSSGIQLGHLFISGRCAVIRSSHLHKDQNELYHTLGTTGSGVGPAYGDKVKRNGYLWFQVLEINKNNLIPDPFTSLIWEISLNSSFYVLLEGSQGFGLDLDIGHYPYVTSTPCTPNLASLGLDPSLGYDTVLITKPYETRSGEDPYLKQDSKTKADQLSVKTVDLKLFLETIQKEGNEIGSTTGRPRSVYLKDWGMFQKAVRTLNPILIVYNKMDIFYSISKDPKFQYIFRYFENKFNGFHSFSRDDIFCTTLYKHNILLGLSPTGENDYLFKEKEEVGSLSCTIKRELSLLKKIKEKE